MNKALLIGHLGRDPEMRATRDGRKIANLSIATSERWRDKASGERKERTEWHRVVIFNEGLAGVAERYLRKGSRVYLEGELQTRKWTDQSGADKYTTEIVLTAFRGQLELLDSKGDGETRGEPDASYDREGQSTRHKGGGYGEGFGGGGESSVHSDLDDEIPFWGDTHPRPTRRSGGAA